MRDEGTQEVVAVLQAKLGDPAVAAGCEMRKDPVAASEMREDQAAAAAGCVTRENAAFTQPSSSISLTFFFAFLRMIRLVSSQARTLYLTPAAASI